MRRLLVLAILQGLMFVTAACGAEMITSHLGHPGPAFAPGMTPGELGWGPDDKPYPDRFVVNPQDGAEMAWIPPGEFTMGSAPAVWAPGEGNMMVPLPDQGGEIETPQHRVMLSGFWMDRTPVTNEQYAKFLAWITKTGDHSRCFKGEPAHKNHTPRLWEGQPSWVQFKGPKQPVVCVDWYDAYAYAAWAGMRLPTEAEWEKAARGTDGRAYPWGNEWDASKCNSKESGNAVTADVGSYPTGQSPYGCLDMAGNVWQWCADWFGDKYYQASPRENPTGPADGAPAPGWLGTPGRAQRGGSWENDAHNCRCACRLANHPDGWSQLFGFRCARSPEGPPPARSARANPPGPPGQSATTPGTGAFVGTVTLRNGDTLTGTIQVADLGVVEGAGIGTRRGVDFGSLILRVNGAEQVILGRDMAAIEVMWLNARDDAQPVWTIPQVTVTKKDGTVIVGQITWKVPVSILSIVTDRGEGKRVYSVPFSNMDFSPDKLIRRIVIGKTPPG